MKQRLANSDNKEVTIFISYKDMAGIEVLNKWLTTTIQSAVLLTKMPIDRLKFSMFSKKDLENIKIFENNIDIDKKI